MNRLSYAFVDIPQTSAPSPDSIRQSPVRWSLYHRTRPRRPTPSLVPNEEQSMSSTRPPVSRSTRLGFSVILFWNGIRGGQPEVGLGQMLGNRLGLSSTLFWNGSQETGQSEVGRGQLLGKPLPLLSSDTVLVVVLFLPS